MKLKNKTLKIYKGKVHDLTVENSHSYNVEGLGVHNSAAGCLLTWCLDITKIDPIPFKLYFERFLNPYRDGSPDLDIDFAAGTDERTLQFLIDKYGQERIVSVITFSTFNERGCLKDVAKALGQDGGFQSDAFAVSKEMPDTFEITLEEWFKTWPKNPECSIRVSKWLTDPNNKEIIDIVLKMQGQVRNLGKHAAGIIIAPSEIWRHIPVNISKGTVLSGFQESSFSKDLSSLGILKLDRLKLETLNVIKDAIKLVKDNKGIDIQEKVDFVNLNDQNLYTELRIGNNHGIFQFESPGMNSLVKGIKVEKFDEVVACSALFRPGPLNIGAHEEYIKNKFLRVEERKYVSKALIPLLEETNGVLIFQEQLMFIAHEIGGLTLGEGDNLRKVMDKASKIISKVSNKDKVSEEELKNKNYKEYLVLWERFQTGAKEKGLDEKDIMDIEAWLVRYLGYSFNKCLTKNHKIKVKNKGEVDLLDIKVGDYVLGYNQKRKKDEFNKVKNIYKSGIKKVYKITTESGKVLECTLNHKILTNEGMISLEKILKNNLKIKILYEKFEKIIEIEEIGEVETYDLEIDSEFHNYYANDVCVSNSHSVSYSYITAQTLFLKHYYPTEFYVALLNHPKSNNNKEKEKQWVQSAILSAMSKGIEIVPPTIQSNWEW
ncbi:MAG: hypothetical protein WC933_03825, partial [Candidatus Paceibacterota bacterium]